MLTNSGGPGSDDIGSHLLNPAVPIREPDRREPMDGHDGNPLVAPTQLASLTDYQTGAVVSRVLLRGSGGP